MKPENVPTYAACPWHGEKHIDLNLSTQMYVCTAETVEGSPAYSKYCTRFGQPVCTWQTAQRRKPNVYAEHDFGGAFDGVRVTSDADDGL